jgi:hypothetical protein
MPGVDQMTAHRGAHDSGTNPCDSVRGWHLPSVVAGGAEHKGSRALEAGLAGGSSNT